MLRFCVLAGCALLAACSSAPSSARPGDPVKGAAVFQRCSACHDATSTETKFGPGLKGLFARSGLRNGKPPDEANVRAQIENGGRSMPAYKGMLTGQEVNDLIAYLKTL